MNKQVIITIVAGLVVAALVGFGWWWFINRAQTTPSATGTFGAAGNKAPGGSAQGNTTNVGLPTLPTNGIPAGKYLVKSTTGQEVGNYSIIPTGNGTYAVAATDGSGALGAGTYVLTIDNVTATYVAAPVGTDGPTTLYSIELAPYGVGTTFTGGGTSLSTTTTSISTSSIPSASTYTPATTTDLGLGSTDTSGVEWLDANSSGGTVFNSSDVSGFSTNNPFTTSGSDGGTITTLNSSDSSGSSGSSALTTVGVAVATGVVSCTLPSLAATLAGSFALSVAGQALGTGGTAEAQAGIAAPGVWPTIDVGARMGAAGAATAAKGDGVTNAASAISNNLNLSINLSNLISSRLLDCFARQIAKALLKTIAQSTIAWINSGFNGKPSFVQNYNSFFTSVADTAAGNFIKGSSLSFLCSAFSLKVRIAIASSYSSTSGQSCSLTSVISNVKNFMSNFSSGGWPGFLSFTTMPTNNPYGAYMYGSIGMSAAANSAKNTKALDLSLGGGFLSITQKSNCQKTTGSVPTAKSGQEVSYSWSKKDSSGNPTSDATPVYEVCDVKNVTPGQAVSSALDQTLGINTQSLEFAQYFDQILSALVSQLIQNVAYKGLSNLSSSSNGYTTDTTYGTASDTSSGILSSILSNVPSLTQSASQLTSLYEENISKLNDSLDKAQTVRSCWQNLNTTTAAQKLIDLDTTIANLESQISSYSSKKEAANSGVSTLQNIESQALSTSDTTSLSNIMSSLSTSVASGSYAQDSDVVNAQEDQILLNSKLSDTNSSLDSQLKDCQTSGGSATSNTTTATSTASN